MNTTRIFKVIVVAVFIGLASTSSAVEEKWTRKTDMPTERFGLSTSVVDSKIYAIGGGKTPQGAYLSTVEEYDPMTDTWTTKADMPTGRNGHAASVVNGKIYVVGGDVRPQVSCSTVEEFDPTTDAWTRRADMPTERNFLCTCAVEGKIYAFGGITAPSTNTSSTVEVYDPESDSWMRKADMPMTRIAATACVVDSKIYLIGGVVDGLEEAAISTVEEYDPMTDTWTRKADMPSARMVLSTSVVDGKIYAIGGIARYNRPVLSTVEEYDPTTDTWTTKANMPTARQMLSTSAVNGKIYAIGGSVIGWPWTGTSIMEEYNQTPPPPDFNGDSIVDISDLLLLIESWDQDNPLVDIAPPFGDGIVDVLDLELLMSYWKQSIDDPTLIAHWALDEAEGVVAYDSAGVNDAVVVGGAVWQPSGGQVGGAVQLDGINGYAIANPVLNPANGSFSVFAWIKGGQPGQVVLSQSNGTNWLGADPDFGCLMTDLMPSAVGRFVPQPLISESVITDGEWHCIGFVWDGANRSLYVDDVLVADDTQANLQGSDSSLYIGCGKTMEPGTYWSGLIDDVRIYNRVVSP